MGQVVCAMSVSLDGYYEGPGGDISWHLVDEELHWHFNEVSAAAAVFVDGRRTYELMATYWPTADANPESSEPEVEYARIWRDKPKIVYSRQLQDAGWNTTIRRELDPSDIAELKRQGDVGLGGGQLAAAFRERDLIDAYRIYVHPVLLGAGTPLFGGPMPLQRLRLVETRRFGNGVVLLHHERNRD